MRLPNRARRMKLLFAVVPLMLGGLDGRGVSDQASARGPHAPLGLTPAVAVSRDGMDARDPDVAVGPMGILFCAWGRLMGWTAYSVSYDSGATFTRPRLLEVRGRQPAALFTANSTLVVVAASADTFLTCSRSTTRGRSFLPQPWTVQSLAGTSNPALALNPSSASPLSGQVQLVWELNLGVWYSRSSNHGATFIAPAQLASGTTRNNAWGPDVAADAVGTVYVAWNKFQQSISVTNTIQLTRSIDNGPFGPLVTLSDVGRHARHVQIVACCGDPVEPSPGVADVMWVYAGNPDSLVAVESTDSGASFARRAAVALPGDGGGSSRLTSLVRAADGTLHAVVQAPVGGNQECFHLTLPDGSTTFTAPVNLSLSPGPSLSPDVAIDGAGVPVLVWSDLFGGAGDILLRRNSP